MKLIKNIVCTAAMTISVTAFGQQDTNRAFFKQAMNLVNPAFAGSQNAFVDSQRSNLGNKSEIGIDFRSQWAGVEGAPETQSVFFSSNMGKNVGLGVSVVNDRTFIENQTSIAVDFSYKLKLDDYNYVYLGIKAGATSYNANLAGLTTFGFGSDPSLNNINGGFNPTVGAGALLKGAHYFVSLSTPNFITSERLEDNDGTARLGQSRPHFYFAGGYDFSLGGSMTLRAAGIARYVEATPLSMEFNTLLDFNNKIQLGPTYRIGEGIGGLFIFNAAGWIDLGYGYEVASNSPVASQSMGTHEIFMKLKM
jgi:type IX secretion system PorP/SprF family membrane protein